LIAQPSPVKAPGGESVAPGTLEGEDDDLLDFDFDDALLD